MLKRSIFTSTGTRCWSWEDRGDLRDFSISRITTLLLLDVIYLVQSDLLVRWRSCHRANMPPELVGGWTSQLDMGDSHHLSQHEWGCQRSQEGKVQAEMIPRDRHVPEGMDKNCNVLYLSNIQRLLKNNTQHILWEDLWYLGGKSSLLDMGGIVRSGTDMDDRCPHHTLYSSSFWIPWPHSCWQAWSPLHMIP